MSIVERSRAIEVAPIEDGSLLAFYRDINVPERRTFWACASGWALDGMDFMIYPLVIGTIIFSGVGAFLTELYPTRLRGSGQGFCYNFGPGIGALFPFLVGALSTSTSLGNPIAIFAVLAYGVLFIAAFALPEARGRILHADA
jgi:hypothetical protein